MGNIKRRTLALLLLSWPLASVQRLRQPAAAEALYPDEAKELEKMVDAFLARFAAPALKDVVALISAYGGHICS